MAVAGRTVSKMLSLPMLPVFAGGTLTGNGATSPLPAANVAMKGVASVTFASGVYTVTLTSPFQVYGFCLTLEADWGEAGDPFTVAITSYTPATGVLVFTVFDEAGSPVNLATDEKVHLMAFLKGTSANAGQ